MTEQKRRLVMDVVARPPAPEPPAKKKKIGWGKLKQLRGVRPGRRTIWAACAVVAFLAIAGGIILFTRRDTGPLPPAITKATTFPLYYPTHLPSGYVLQQGSAKVDNGVVFFNLQNGKEVVTVSEQATPQNPPDLSRLLGFTSMQTPAGKTAIGFSLGKPIAITLSNTTLITITGTQDLPSDTITTVAKNMASLP